MTDRAKSSQSLPRKVFRWVRIAALLLVLIVFSLVLWANYAGVPEVFARLLRSELRRNNVTLDFRHLRLSGFRRLIADQLEIRSAAGTNESNVQISQAELKFRYSGNPADPVVLSGLRLDGGHLNLAINDPDEPRRFLSITNLRADVEFKRGDTLRIVDFSGEAFGAKAELSGVLRNFSRFRVAESPRRGEKSQWRRQVREVLDIAEQLSFAHPPELSLSFGADATNLVQTRGSIALRADEGSSRWARFKRLRLNSMLTPMTNTPGIKATFNFVLDDVSSEEARADVLRINAESQWTSDMQQLLTNHVGASLSRAMGWGFASPQVDAQLASTSQKESIESVLTVAATDLTSASSKLSENVFTARLRHALPFPTPGALLGNVLSTVPRGSTNHQIQQISGEWVFNTARAQLPRATAEAIHAAGEINTRALPPADLSSLSFWEYFAPFDLPWQLQLSNLVAGEMQVGTLTTRGRWNFPELSVSEINADLYKGKMAGRAALDVQSRRLTASAETSFDYHQASVLLDPPVQEWLKQFAWENPPYVQTELACTLPAWTAKWQDPQRHILPSLTMSGRFEGRGSFREIPLGLAQSHFHFTNFVWSLPDLKITRPEGKALVQYSGNVTNQQIAVKLESELDPLILAAAFEEKLRPAFQMVRFATPPRIEAEIGGNLDDPATLAARGTLMATNFFAKEQAMTDLRTDFSYRDQKIELLNLVAHRGKEEVRAPYSRVDIPGEVMFVTNAISTIDPYIAMSLVGDEVYDAIAPYRFANTPTVTINGFVPLRHVSKANLHFGVSGTDFTYWRFHLAHLSGDVYWKGLELSFSNVVAEFYNGTATWSGYFQIERDTPDANFSFHGTAANASLHPLVRDLFSTTNQLEGTLNGDLVITSATTASIQSWNGYGSATLKDGYLWSIPVFGIFSPALDSIAPGLGSTPVSSGAGNFTITNSVIYTRDLQVRAPAFRLNYKGNVDLNGKLDARVEAEILRDTWVIGKLFSTALWPVSKAFEAEVSGQLNNPKTKFRFVPRFVLAPFKVVGAIAEAAKKKEQKNSTPPSAETATPATREP